METRIVCAAIRRRDTKQIICGARHFDNVMREQIGGDIKYWRDAEQGFIDQFCRYHDRGDAYVIAEKNGQIIRECPGDEGTLFSENLY